MAPGFRVAKCVLPALVECGLSESGRYAIIAHMLDHGYNLLGRLARASRIRGRVSLAQLLVRYPASLTYRDALGFTRHTNLDERLDACWFLGVNWCLLPQAVVERIPVGTMAIDAGANIGIVTSQLCRAVGASGTVHAIEPLPANAGCLRELKRKNDLEQLTIWECALSDKDGSSTLRTQGEGTSAYASLTASWNTAGTVLVETRVLDDLVPRDTRVGFVKLDVEGAESLVLDGADRIMASDRPMVFCEFNDIVLRDAGSSARELLAKFKGLGYAPAAEYPQGDGISDFLLTPE
jgi:FkbM family methyltransferase